MKDEEENQNKKLKEKNNEKMKNKNGNRSVEKLITLIDGKYF
jgi:hypothetical protein